MVAVSEAQRTTPRRFVATPGQIGLALAIALFLALFLVIPVVTVIYVAFTEKGSGAFTLTGSTFVCGDGNLDTGEQCDPEVDEAGQYGLPQRGQPLPG